MAFACVQYVYLTIKSLPQRKHAASITDTNRYDTVRKTATASQISCQQRQHSVLDTVQTGYWTTFQSRHVNMAAQLHVLSRLRMRGALPPTTLRPQGMGFNYTNMCLLILKQVVQLVTTALGEPENVSTDESTKKTRAASVTWIKRTRFETSVLSYGQKHSFILWRSPVEISQEVCHAATLAEVCHIPSKSLLANVRMVTQIGQFRNSECITGWTIRGSIPDRKNDRYKSGS
jgi:hypothetical protein